MSGTSLDGVDAALVSFDGPQPRLIATHYLPYPDEVRQSVLRLQSVGNNELHEAAMLAQVLARLYARVVGDLLATSNTRAAKVRAIGCHGQTIRHNPAAGYSLQLNQPALLAELTGIAVVADFRSRDIAAGGEGAPLVPAFHEAIFGVEARRRVVLNIGGIANLTDLTPGAETLGFDCGPGNMLMDAWIGLHTGQHYDRNGEWARQGVVLPALLETLLQHTYFSKRPPKSCGREEFNLDFLKAHLGGNELAADVQRTLLELTAVSIGRAIAGSESERTEVLLCGGGAHNGLLVERLKEFLPGCEVKKTDDFGVGADWVEAIAFAWLARQCLSGESGNLPQVTGARNPCVLGAIYPA